MSKKAKFDLNKHTLHLLFDEPFFGALSREITKKADDSIGTAGVRINPESATFELMYSPKFWMSLDAKPGDKDEIVRLGRKGDKLLLLMHEFYHCMFGHVTTRLPKGGMTKAWNIAQDLAINSELFGTKYNFSKDKGSLYDLGVFPGKEGSPFEGYPKGLSAEAYYELIKDDPNFDPDSDDGEHEGFDNHDGFGKADAESEIIAKQRMKSAIAVAAQEAMSNGWGCVSHNMQKQILDLLKSTINWKKVLRYFVKTSQRSDKRSSVMRLNTRYPYIFPGRKSSRTAHVAIAIDQSGSVSDQLLNAFFSELNGLAGIATFTVIPFDHTVAEDKIFQWKKGQTVRTERVLTGGTCFQAPTDYVNEKGCFDGLIIATDMAAPAPGKCNVQRMWVTDPANAAHPYFTTSERVMVVPIGGKDAA